MIPSIYLPLNNFSTVFLPSKRGPPPSIFLSPILHNCSHKNNNNKAIITFPICISFFILFFLFFPSSSSSQISQNPNPLMGYLSCNAESAILTTNTITNNNNNKSKKPTTHNKEESSSSSSPEEKPIKFEQFQYSDLEAATNGFSDKKLLGKGSHGCVYKAVLRSGRLVAVKRPSRSSSSSNLRPTTPSSSDYIANEVDNEIDILSKIQNPRLVNLVGFTTDSRDRLLVVEFMSNGTLYDVIHSSPRPPNWGRRIRLALQTAKAIDTLHSSSPPVIHRDIKSANVLIDRNFNARLGDFGLALRCHVDDFRLLSTPPAGTIGYLDPGYVTPDNLSTKTDVFSFGILLLEIISGRKAIDIGHSPPSIVEWAVPLARKGKFLSVYDPRILPPKDPSVRKQLLVLASKCVRSCRERRPSMKDVVESLSVMSKMVPLHSWNGFSVTNPCMMVEAVGRPVESRNGQLNSRPRRRGGEGDNNTLDNNVVGQMRNSRRVYSDLGVGTRSNLMDLMAERDLTESDSRGEGGDIEPVFSRTRGSSLRIGNERRFSRERTQSSAHDYDKDGVFQLRRNQSVGGMFRKSLREEVLDRSNGGLKHQNISS